MDSRKTWADVLQFGDQKLPRELIGEIFLRLDPVCAAHQTQPLIVKLRDETYYQNLWVSHHSSFAIPYSRLLEPLPPFHGNGGQPVSEETIHLIQLLSIGLDKAIKSKLAEDEKRIKAMNQEDPSIKMLIKQRNELIREIFYHPSYYTGSLIVELFDQIALLGRDRFRRVNSILYEMLRSNVRLPIELVNQLYHKIKPITTRPNQVTHDYHLLTNLIEETLLTLAPTDTRLNIPAAVYDNLELAEHCLFGTSDANLFGLYESAVKYRAGKILQLITDRGSEVSGWSIRQMIRPTIPWRLVQHLTRNLRLRDLVSHDECDLVIKLYHEREWSDEEINQTVNQICKDSYEYGETILPLLSDRFDCVVINHDNKGDNYLLYHSLRYGNGHYRAYPELDKFPLSDDYIIQITPEQAQAKAIAKGGHKLESLRYQTITITNGSHHLAISDYYADFQNVYHRQENLNDIKTPLSYHVLHPGESITLNRRQVGELNIVSFDY